MWYWIYRSNLVRTLSLKLICYTTNSLKDEIQVFLSELFGFLKFKKYECCSHSLWFHTRDCVPSPSTYRSLKMPEKTPYLDRVSGYNHEEAQREAPLQVHNRKQGHHGPWKTPRAPCGDCCPKAWVRLPTTVGPWDPPWAVVVAMARPWSGRLHWLPWKTMVLT